MEEIEELSVAQLLLADDFSLYTDHIPLRPVGRAVSTAIVNYYNHPSAFLR